MFQAEQMATLSDAVTLSIRWRVCNGELIFTTESIRRPKSVAWFLLYQKYATCRILCYSVERENVTAGILEF
jgi:hypothetical protein